MPSRGPEIAFEVLAWIAENAKGGVTKPQCSNVLVGAGRAGDADVIERVFELMEQCGLERSIQQYNLLLSAYVRVNRPEDAFTLFRQLSSAGEPQPSIVTFNTLIAACGSVKRGAACVRELMSAMTSAGVAADVITYNVALKVLGAKGMAREAEELLTEMTSAGIRPTEVTYLALIDMYGRVPGRLLRAEQIYRQMLRDPIVRPETPQLSAMMSAYARAGDWESTERVFQDLMSRGLNPDHMVFVARLTAHGNARRGSGVKTVWSEMQSAGLTPNFITWTAFVDALARSGDLSGAEKALQEMTSSGIPPTARSFTVLFDAYVTSGRLAEGAGLLTRMVRDFNCKPNVGIYTVQIGHLCHVAAYDDAARVFREMLRVGIRPELHTYVTLMSAVCALLEKECASSKLATSADATSLGATSAGLRSANVRTLLDAIGCCDEPLYRATHSLLDPSTYPEETEIFGFAFLTDGLTYQQQCDFFSQLIGALWFGGLRNRAFKVLCGAHSEGEYSEAVSEGDEEWSVDMHRVSPGVAQLLLVILLRQLHTRKDTREYFGRARTARERGEGNEGSHGLREYEDQYVMPWSVKAITGWGKHSAGEGEAVVGKAVGDLIRELGAPFQPSKLGSYTATGEDLRAWFKQPGTADKLALHDDA